MALSAGIDVRPALYGRGGIARYVRELVPALARAFPGDRFELYGHRLRGRRGRAPLGPLPANARLHDRALPAMGVQASARFGWGADRVLGGVDVLHWTDYVALPSSRAPVVATVHDVLFASLPDAYTPVMRCGLTHWTRLAVRTARRLIVPSERTKRDLVARFGADAERVDVVPHGVAPLSGEAASVNGRGPYVLALGTLEPRKNLTRLLDAVDVVRARGTDLGVVVVGARGWLDGPILAAIAARPHVIHEATADEARKAALLLGAHVLAFPSLGEGFGLPVLEGFAAGVPVLVGAGTACADLGGDAALAADPRDVGALADGLERLACDEALRARLVARGRAVAAAHTWERAARLTHAAYARSVTT